MLVMSVISIIAAVASNGVIGLNNTLPWHLPEDLKRFRSLTMGHHIIMGRNTFESLGRLLPGRITVIVSRNPDYVLDGAIVVTSLPEAIAACGDDPEIFVIGGAQLYRQAIASADRMYLTEIDAAFEGDVHFPDYERAHWKELAREVGVTPQGLRYAYVTYERA
jgi:dihydrofolate reductase